MAVGLFKNMIINVRSQKFEISQSVKDYLNKKIKSLERLLSTFKTEPKIFVVFSQVEKKIFSVKINVDLGREIIRVEKKSYNIYSALDEAKDDLKIQLRKYRKRMIGE